jgi:hypothetical protein
MLCVIATWLISWAAASPADELVPPPWPAGMKAERTADGGAKLNAIAADAVHEHLEWGERVPELTREIIESHVREAVRVQAEEHQVDMAQQAARVGELERERWSTLQRVGAVMSGAIVGAAIGFVAAAVMR